MKTKNMSADRRSGSAVAWARREDQLGARGSTGALSCLGAIGLAALLGLCSGPTLAQQSAGGEGEAARSASAATEGIGAALARRYFSDEAAGEGLGPLSPAGDWRVIAGAGLKGVLRMSTDARAARGRYGFFAFTLKGRGVYEGVYNVKPGGRALIGVFWPDGALNQGAAAGFLELTAQSTGAGRGGLTFIKGGEVDGLRAR